MVAALSILSSSFYIAEEATRKEFALIEEGLVAFPIVSGTERTAVQLQSVTMREWKFEVEHGDDRSILRAQLGGQTISQHVRPNSDFKYVAFDLERRRFLPLGREIHIRKPNDTQLAQIQALDEVVDVKRYDMLGQAIITLKNDTDPIAVLQHLKRKFGMDDARISSGINENQPL